VSPPERFPGKISPGVRERSHELHAGSALSHIRIEEERQVPAALADPGPQALEASCRGPGRDERRRYDRVLRQRPAPCGDSRPPGTAIASPPIPGAMQFGGYCAYAVSQGCTADADPTVWRIVDDRLYVNYSCRAAALWERDLPGNIAKGHRNWPGVLGP
jgi:hypothetical protein